MSSKPKLPRFTKYQLLALCKQLRAKGYKVNGWTNGMIEEWKKKKGKEEGNEYR